MDWDGTDALQERWIQDKEMKDMENARGEKQVLAEDLELGDMIYQEDGHGNQVECQVYRIRRVSHLEGILSTSAGDARVPLNHPFTVLNR
jgi:hypothetical protein